MSLTVYTDQYPLNTVLYKRLSFDLWYQPVKYLGYQSPDGYKNKNIKISYIKKYCWKVR